MPADHADHAAPHRPSVLILGGTDQARELAGLLNARHVPVTTSLAGRTGTPVPTAGNVRIGGFGGAGGLADHLRTHHVTVLVDATHPYATRISRSATEAATAAGVPLVRLTRPGAGPPAPGERRHTVPDETAAAALLPQLGHRALLTVGRMRLAAFAAVPASVWCLIRSIDPPVAPLPPNHETLLARGPFTVEGELALMRDHAIDILVTRDSGASSTGPKLEAARTLGVPTILIVRAPAAAAAAMEPPAPSAPAVPAGPDAQPAPAVPAGPPAPPAPAVPAGLDAPLPPAPGTDLAPTTAAEAIPHILAALAGER